MISGASCAVPASAPGMEGRRKRSGEGWQKIGRAGQGRARQGAWTGIKHACLIKGRDPGCRRPRPRRLTALDGQAPSCHPTPTRAPNIHGCTPTVGRTALATPASLLQGTAHEPGLHKVPSLQAPTCHSLAALSLRTGTGRCLFVPARTRRECVYGTRLLRGCVSTAGRSLSGQQAGPERNRVPTRPSGGVMPSWPAI